MNAARASSSSGLSIRLNAVSLRFQFQWVFRNVSLEFLHGQSYALVGPNGAGKSSLLRILCGHLTPSRGKVIFETAKGHKISADQVYRHISMTGPYMELIEEFSLVEAIRFHRRFQPFTNHLSASDVLELLEFPNHSRHKEIRFFSSGMKQRLKIGLAVLSATDALLIDEPSTNLDDRSIEWYHSLLGTYTGNRLLVVASNVAEDFGECQHRIDIRQMSGVV